MKLLALFFTIISFPTATKVFAQTTDTVPSVENNLSQISDIKADTNVLTFLKVDTIVNSFSGKSSEIVNKNFIKLNLLNIAIRNFSLQYERVLSKRFSFALGFRYMPSGSLPFLSSIESATKEVNQEANESLTALTVSNTAITPEIRFFVGRKGYGRGFYLAPFYRYVSFSTNKLPVSYDSDTDKETINLSGKLITKTVGLQLGAQWMLSKRISLDWWIMGPQFGSHLLELNGLRDNNFSESEKSDIEGFNLKLANIEVKPKVIDNTVRSSSSGEWGGSFLKVRDISREERWIFGVLTGLRTGLCLGVRF